MEKLFFTDALKRLIKKDEIIKENAIFRLHYQATSLLLIVFSALVSATQFFGDPIQCIQRDIPANILNTYCWIEGTFSIPKAFTKIVGQQVAYSGVQSLNPGDEVQEHAYYQWVCFMLFLQACLFYTPRLLWVSWEGGRILYLLQELQHPVISADSKKTKYQRLIKYFLSNMYLHSGYAYRYVLCEILNLVNVIGQIYFIDTFLGGQFTTYGVEVVRFAATDPEERYDPMVKVFPRLTKCTFYKYGSSGDVQRYDALCLLPLNIVNEKIYIFLWFWFIILSVFTSLVVACRLAMIRWPKIRFYLLRALSRLTPHEHLQVLVEKMPYPDWFVLYLLGKNMDSLHYKDLLSKLARQLEAPLEDDESGETVV